jgi:transcriptional regulator with XRE-family HTH domain
MRQNSKERKPMFSENMKAIRKKRGWSLKELAQIIGSDPTTLWKYEKSMREPAYNILKAMVKKAGVSPAELF